MHLGQLILEIFILGLIVNGAIEVHSEFDKLKNIDKKHYCSNYHDVSVNK